MACVDEEFNRGEEIIKSIFSLIMEEGKLDAILEADEDLFKSRFHAFAQITHFINEELADWKKSSMRGLPPKFKTLLFLAEQRRGGEMTLLYINEIFEVSRGTNEANLKKLKDKVIDMQKVENEGKGLKDKVLEGLGDGMRWALRAISNLKALKSEETDVKEVTSSFLPEEIDDESKELVVGASVWSVLSNWDRNGKGIRKMFKTVREAICPQVIFNIASAFLSSVGVPSGILELVSDAIGLGTSNLPKFMEQFGDKRALKEAYKTLDLKETATLTEVGKRGKVLAFQFHPDKFPNATPQEVKLLEENFNRVRKAVSVIVLSREKSKRGFSVRRVFGLGSKRGKDDDHKSEKRKLAIKDK